MNENTDVLAELKEDIKKIKEEFPGMSDYEALMAVMTMHRNFLFEQAFMANSVESIFSQIMEETTCLHETELDSISIKLDKLLQLNTIILDGPKKEKLNRIRRAIRLQKQQKQRGKEGDNLN